MTKGARVYSAARAARSARERDWRYDVVITSQAPKLELLKLIREALPTFGLTQGLAFVQGPMPSVVLAGVPRREARRAIARLRAKKLKVSMRSTASSRAPLTIPASPEPPPQQPAEKTQDEDLTRHQIACEVLIRTHAGHDECGCPCHKGDE